MPRAALVAKAQKKQKYKVRRYRRCALCGRQRSVIRKFSLCRLCFRRYASEGKIPGVVKSSW